MYVIYSYAVPVPVYPPIGCTGTYIQYVAILSMYYVATTCPVCIITKWRWAFLYLVVYLIEKKKFRQLFMIYQNINEKVLENKEKTSSSQNFSVPARIIEATNDIIYLLLW